MNPGCHKHCQNLTTLYLRADGANDTLHYLWDFAVGKPSVLLALTPASAWLNITWPDYLNRREKSVRFSEPPSYTFGVIVNKVTLLVDSPFPRLSILGLLRKFAPARSFHSNVDFVASDERSTD